MKSSSAGNTVCQRLHQNTEFTELPVWYNPRPNQSFCLTQGLKLYGGLCLCCPMVWPWPLCPFKRSPQTWSFSNASALSIMEVALLSQRWNSRTGDVSMQACMLLFWKGKGVLYAILSGGHYCICNYAADKEALAGPNPRPEPVNF